MNINSGNIGELAGNQSILDKKERKHFKGIVFFTKNNRFFVIGW